MCTMHGIPILYKVVHEVREMEINGVPKSLCDHMEVIRNFGKSRPIRGHHTVS